MSGSTVMTQPLSTFGENVSAGYLEARALQPISPLRFERDWWDGVVTQIKEQTGETFRNPVQPIAFNPLLERGGYYAHTAQNIQKFVKENQDRLRLGHPDEPGGSNLLMLDGPAFGVKMGEMSREQALSEIAEADEVYGRSRGVVSSLGSLLGSLGGSVTDPFNGGVSLTMAAMSGGLSLTAQPLAQTVLREAMLGMAAETAQQPAVAQYYKSLDLPYDFSTFTTMVLTAGTVAGAFPVAVRGGLKAGQTTAKIVGVTDAQIKKLADVIYSTGVKKSAAAKVAELKLDVQTARAADNPLEGPGGKLEHKQRELAGIESAINMQEPKISTVPTSAVKTQSLKQVEIFTPDEIDFDAAFFKAKQGGDTAVTQDLSKATEYSAADAGEIIVYEFSDGRKVVADGQQRLLLAKRIKKADPSQQIELKARVLKQSDGLTIDEAVIIARGANSSNLSARLNIYRSKTAATEGTPDGKTIKVKEAEPTETAARQSGSSGGESIGGRSDEGVSARSDAGDVERNIDSQEQANLAKFSEPYNDEIAAQTDAMVDDIIADLEAADPKVRDDLLDAEYPSGIPYGDQGETVPTIVTGRQILDEIVQEDLMIERLSRCPI